MDLLHAILLFMPKTTILDRNGSQKHPACLSKIQVDSHLILYYNLDAVNDKLDMKQMGATSKVIEKKSNNVFILLDD